MKDTSEFIEITRSQLKDLNLNAISYLTLKNGEIIMVKQEGEKTGTGYNDAVNVVTTENVVNTSQPYQGATFQESYPPLVKIPPEQEVDGAEVPYSSQTEKVTRSKKVNPIGFVEKGDNYTMFSSKYTKRKKGPKQAAASSNKNTSSIVSDPLRSRKPINKPESVPVSVKAPEVVTAPENNKVPYSNKTFQIDSAHTGACPGCGKDVIQCPYCSQTYCAESGFDPNAKKDETYGRKEVITYYSKPRKKVRRYLLQGVDDIKAEEEEVEEPEEYDLREFDNHRYKEYRHVNKIVTEDVKKEKP